MTLPYVVFCVCVFSKGLKTTHNLLWDVSRDLNPWLSIQATHCQCLVKKSVHYHINSPEAHLSNTVPGSPHPGYCSSTTKCKMNTVCATIDVDQMTWPSQTQPSCVTLNNNKTFLKQQSNITLGIISAFDRDCFQPQNLLSVYTSWMACLVLTQNKLQYKCSWQCVHGLWLCG